MHWTMETIFSAELDFASLSHESALIQVRPEVPMEGPERLPRRGNRYFATDVDVTVSAEDFTLTPAEARQMGQELIKAADAADAIDKADTDACGHWWPCRACQAESA